MILRKIRKQVAIGLTFVLTAALAFAFVNTNLFAEPGGTIFSLQEHMQGQNFGDAFDFGPRLQGAGGPSFTVVELNGAAYLQIAERTANWNAIDIHRTDLYIGDILTVTGFAYDPPEGTQMILGGAESPWNWAANTEVSADNYHFSLELTLNAGHFEDDQFVRFRVQTNDDGAEMTFYISEISIVRPEDAVPPADAPPAPAPQPPPAIGDGEGLLIYSLHSDAYVAGASGASNLDGTAFLEVSGTPSVSIENGVLYLTDRSENWHTIDVSLAALDLAFGGTYRFVASGTAEPGTQIAWHRSYAPWTFVSGLVDTPPTGEWVIDATLQYPFVPEMANLRIQTNAAPNVDLTINSISVYALGIAMDFQTLYYITFDNFEIHENYITAGAQMSGSLYNFDGNPVFRLENVTGDYTSGNGNYLRFDLPTPVAAGTYVRISWDVFVPSAENPGNRNIVGPGLNINSMFGQPTAQPTNDQDLSRNIGMDAWYTTTTQFMVSHEVGSHMEHLIFRFRVNDNEQQPSVLYIDNINVSYGGEAAFIPPEWDLGLPSLQEQFLPFFLFGNIYPTTSIMDQFDTRQMYLHHFNAITAENWHKPDNIAPGGFQIPTADSFDFSQADAIVDWAIQNDLTLVGHAFVWHSQSPNWLFWESDGVPHTRAQARENMHFYISTLANHFVQRGVLGKFYSWDVTNEVIASGGGTWNGDLDDWNAGDWRTQMRETSPWFMAYANGYNPAAGEHPSDFVYDAFVFARHYFPYSILYYNDYNEEVPAKRNAIAQMVEQLNERWANDFENNPEAVPVGQVYTGRLLIEAIGMQSHFHMPMGGWSTNFDNVRPAIERFAATGTILSVTELDITVGAHGAGATSFPDGLSDYYLQRQAELYARIFNYYLEFANYIQRVSLWGLADNQSWRAPGHPLIFDGSFTAKPAFFAILDTVANAPTPAVQAPNFVTTALPIAAAGSHYITQIAVERNNHSPVRFSATGLPQGLVMHSTTGVIEGTTTQVGTHEVSVTVSNLNFATPQTFTLTVAQGEGIAAPVEAPVAQVDIVDTEELVWIRQFAENLGFSVDWFEATQTITITNDAGFYTSFSPDNIVDGRAYVTLGFAEQLLEQ
ncbi:MAG: endo-1,4-beta-xylanase [Defluviitaleaceae bacterium]|nr:endo-1,4-beta-xylanase [Defluviitaleaceae bacterium]